MNFIFSRIAPVIRQASGSAFHSIRHAMASRSCSMDQRVVHEGDGVAQRAADRDDAFGDHGVALVRHGRGADLALGEGLGELVDLVVGEADDLGGDLGEAAADEPEHADVFDEAVARRLPGDVGDAEAEPRHHHGVELEGAVAERGLGADRADQAADEGRASRAAAAARSCGRSRKARSRICGRR